MTPISFPFCGLLKALLLAVLVFALCASGLAGALSPEHWSEKERAELERLEQRNYPDTNRDVDGAKALVAGTMSPVSVKVGMEVLRHGGNAADAASAMALTQVSRSLGSFVSYAGIVQGLYFDAKTGKVHSLDGGWGTYREEKDLKNIPLPSDAQAPQGRKTLVPGFMAGLESLHGRFGRLPFAELFEPAIWYAEHGVPISPMLSHFFRMRQKELSRTSEGRSFMAQAGRPMPENGDLFKQPAVARLLREVAQRGSATMYTGAWGKRYVEVVRSEGGKVTSDDMAAYKPIWQEALSTSYAGHVVYGPGRSSEGGYQALMTLNLIEAMKVDRLPPYWKDADSFLRLGRIMNVTDMPAGWMLERAKGMGLQLSVEDRASKAFAEKLAPSIEGFFRTPECDRQSSHSAGIVVIDEEGNIAALVHTINTVVWGSTGILVEGIPIADAASTNAYFLQSIEPGRRLPDLMVPVIVTRDGKPAFAAAITGSLQRETVRLLLARLGYGLDAQAMLAAPPLVADHAKFSFEFTLPEDGYDSAFAAGLTRKGISFQRANAEQVRNLRGVGVIGIVTEAQGRRQGADAASLFGFSAAY